MSNHIPAISKINPATILFLISIFFISCGGSCSKSNSSEQGKKVSASPLDPEQLGYYKEFGELWQPAAESTYSLLEIDAVVKLNGEVEKTELSREQKNKLKSSFNTLKTMADKKLPTLQQTLPPSSIEDFHSQLVKLLNAIRISNSLDETVVAQSKIFYAAYRKVDKEFKGRPKEIQLDDGPMSVEFKPVFSPVAGNVNLQSGAFNLVWAREIVTPVGSALVNIASQQSSSPSPKFLVIQHNKKRRYVYLSPGSKFFVPTKCGVGLLNDREDSRIIVEVAECSQDQASQTDPAKNPSNEYIKTPSDVSQRDTDFDMDRIQKVVTGSVSFLSKENQKFSGTVTSSGIRNAEPSSREFVATINWEDERQSSIVLRSDNRVIVSISDVQYTGKWSWKDNEKKILLVEMDKGARYIFSGS
jgi:hypothetical protein